MSHLSSVLCVLLSLLLVVQATKNHDHGSPQHHHNSGRRHRQIPHFPERNELSADQCGKREHHVMCGPERQCDRSCDNLFSPTNCIHISSHPKCYFPRCLCNEGLVRNAHGRCIRPSQCPNRYSEPGTSGDDNDLRIEFQPMKFQHHRVRRVRHRKPVYVW